RNRTGVLFLPPERHLILPALPKACGPRILSGGSVAPSIGGAIGFAIPAAVPGTCTSASRRLRTVPLAIYVSALTTCFRKRGLARSRIARCRSRRRVTGRIVSGAGRRLGARQIRLRGGAFEAIGPCLIAWHRGGADRVTRDWQGLVHDRSIAFRSGLDRRRVCFGTARGMVIRCLRFTQFWFRRFTQFWSRGIRLWFRGS